MSPRVSTSPKGLAPAILVAALLSACVAVREPDASGPAPSDSGRLRPDEVARSVLDTMDRMADPCQDFYQYACGSWLRRTRLPADQSRWGRGFSEVAERNRIILRDILEGAARSKDGDTDRDRMGTFYAACMDEEMIERVGVAPLQEIFAGIAGVEDAASLMRVVGWLHSDGLLILFLPVVKPDFRDPKTAIVYLVQGGLGLPDRDYYLKSDDRSRDLRQAYGAHVARMLELAGDPPDEARQRAIDILAFETGLARASMPRETARDPEAVYHRVDRDGLQTSTPALPWSGYFEQLHHPALRDISIGMPDFFGALSALASTTEPGVLRAYLRWHVVHAMADSLPRRFVEENFDFYGRRLSGQREIAPRWRRCVDAADRAVGESLGRDFVARSFGGDSKPTAIGMIRGIEQSLEGAFGGLAWMDDSTRALAADKLRMVANKIGYPEVWRDYSTLTFRRMSHFGNVVAAARFDLYRRLDKVGGPVDRDEWEMTPPTVNAYYDPTLNEMVFPAGVMQPPFFHRDFPAAMNYGALGVGMGHELTHGFDDSGRKFDGSGHLRQWWDPGVVQRFEERARCVDSLYSSYEVEPGLRVNGKLTLGENIADLGGIREAYGAYRSRERSTGPTPPAVPGLTDDQLFFVGFAQSWCELITPERARLQISVDPHAPARFRVRGPLASFPAFAEAFSCTPGTPMNPEDKCEVW